MTGGSPWRLLVEQGPRAGEELTLPEGVTLLGRGSAPEVVDLVDPSVSRRQAELVAGPTLVVRDLGSRFGTVVNGVAVDGRGMVLQPGDRIEVGDTTLVVQPVQVEVPPANPTCTATITVELERPDVVVDLEAELDPRTDSTVRRDRLW